MVMNVGRMPAMPVLRRSRRAACVRGFTMVELLITLVILAVLLTVAAPSMATFINSSRLRASQAEFVSALTLARSEATRRGTRVSIAAVAPVEGAELSGGWRVFIDADSSGTFDDGEAELRFHPALTGDVKFATSRPLPIVFDARGFLDGAGAFEFSLCGRPGFAAGYRILLEPIGLTDVLEVTTCTG